jgi:hypothetical protein
MGIIQKFIKMIMLALVLLGLVLIFKNKFEERIVTEQVYSSKSLALKKYFLKHEKPQRIEIFGLSDRFAKDIVDIKKLKISQDLNSNFYATVQLFSDERDTSAPLVAQIRFIDLSSGNLIK